MSRPFEVTREVDLPAAPDDVWTAITSETAAWQFPVGPPLTGAGGPVQTFEPPHRLVVRMESPDGTFNALDFTVEARDGGTAHLRYVHSGILAEEWADQYDAIGPHTDFYLHTLGEYLEHFRGRPVTYVGQPSSGIEGPAAAGEADAMDTLRAALGLGADATAGDPVHARLGESGPLDGVLDHASDAFLGVRTDDGLYRFFGRNHFGGVVGMSAHLFTPSVDATTREAQLQAWLDGVFA
ncbi:MAG: hypothetical protein JWM31_2672 [Solirubrobacterales bacterium]|nr:hypothetical protein [Solirubrobacterales bacterium]